MTTTLLVGSSPDTLATELIRRIGAIATESVQARGVFNVAVSGGSMPKVPSDVSDVLLYTCRCYNLRLVVRAAFNASSESTRCACWCRSVSLES